YVNLVVGLGFEWNQYEFSNKTRLNPDSSYTHGVIDSTNTFSYQKNRLKSTFINVPVLLEFNTHKNPKKAFHIAFGVIGGYKLGSRTRQIVEQNGRTIKYVKKDDYNLNPFRVNAHASIGYHNLTIYADYALTPLFENGKGPELYPFTIGVKLISF
ncbi:MAG: outer membrane beta-barrel protein, partial [Bacteroidia bacterium]|nr:outer membrane beta-barrel protein [Bacteroidia bacterium]